MVDQQPRRRLSNADRHHQLLATAMRIVREEGADRLTLGHLAVSAGVSKPVAYDHFTSRNGLLIELYRWIDTERVSAFRAAMAQGDRSSDETVDALAEVYIACATDLGDEFHAVGAALAGSEEKAAVYGELHDNVVAMFEAVLAPVSTLPRMALASACVGLVGAGDALAEAVGRGRCTTDEATATFVTLISIVTEPDGDRDGDRPAGIRTRAPASHPAGERE